MALNFAGILNCEILNLTKVQNFRGGHQRLLGAFFSNKLQLHFKLPKASNKNKVFVNIRKWSSKFEEIKYLFKLRAIIFAKASVLNFSFDSLY